MWNTSCTHVSGLVRSHADNIGIRPSIGQVKLVGIVGGYALRADREDSLVFSLPRRVLCHEKALQFNILMYFARCSHYLSLRGAFYGQKREKQQQQIIFSNWIWAFVILRIINQKTLSRERAQLSPLSLRFWPLFALIGQIRARLISNLNHLLINFVL